MSATRVYLVASKPRKRRLRVVTEGFALPDRLKAELRVLVLGEKAAEKLRRASARAEGE